MELSVCKSLLKNEYQVNLQYLAQLIKSLGICLSVMFREDQGKL